MSSSSSGDEGRPLAVDARIERAMFLASSRRDVVCVWFGAVMSALALVLLGVTPTPDWQWACILVLTLSVLVNVITAWNHRRSPIPPRTMVLTTVLLSAANVAACAAVGPFSLGAALTCLIIYGFGMSANSYQAFAAYAINALGFLLIGVCFIFGIIPNGETVLALQTLNPKTLWVIVAGAQLTFAGTYWLARETHFSLRTAFVEAHQLKFTARRHEAALQEVHRDLSSALAHGRPGRLTGQTIGRYELRNIIGRGGAGEVYRAYDEERHGDVAVKVLHATRAHDPTHVKRFVREAQVMSGLKSRHIAKVFEVARTDDGYLFLAMERLEGEDLACVLRRQGRMPLPDVLRLVQQVAAGLAVAHHAGVVHRDVKPQNIFSASAGGAGGGNVWKLLDFGISKINGSSLTLGPDAVLGTPGYMAPEQVGNHAVDGQTDVFALAAVSYRALTGAPAFTGNDLATQLYQLLRTQPQDPQLLGNTNADVARVIALGLAKNRNQRIASVVAFAEAFEQAVSDRLDAGWRDEADALLADFPWGSSTDDDVSSEDTGRLGPDQMLVEVTRRRTRTGRTDSAPSLKDTRQVADVVAAPLPAWDDEGFSSSHRRRTHENDDSSASAGSGADDTGEHEWRLYG